MFSVFQQYLNPFIEEGLLPELDETKISNVYELLRIAYNQGASGVIHTTRLFIPVSNEQDYDYELLYAVWSHPEIQEIVDWANKQIIPNMLNLTYKTISVYTRMVCSRLMKLAEKGIIERFIAVRLHLNFAQNLWEEWNLIVDENLPF